MGEQFLETGIPTPIFNPWRWSATHTLAPAKGQLSPSGFLGAEPAACPPTGAVLARRAFGSRPQSCEVAIDSPPPMGLSFCSEHGPTGGPTSCGATRELPPPRRTGA